MGIGYAIRVFGDPVLKQPSTEITELDGDVARLVQGMFTTMYAAPGVGLAASQVGVRKRLFVYDIGDGPCVFVNPTITESSGEWLFEEGCLSVPGLSFPVVRSKLVTITGMDLKGNEVTIEGDELLGRVFLHEMDHLDGVLLIDRLDADDRKVAMRMLREQSLGDAPVRSHASAL